MHEMSIALGIVELAEREATKAGAKRISRIEVEVGELAGVLAEALQFCFTAACCDTMAAGAELVVVAVPGRGECASCGRSAAMTEAVAVCDLCGGIMRPSGGRDLRLLAIEVDD